MPRGRPKKIIIPPEELFDVSLKYNEDNKQGLFKDVSSSLQEFGPKVVKNKVILKVTKKGKSYEKILFAPFARRLFNNENSIQIFSRNIERYLNT